MARANSIVMTPAEKKEALKAAKTELKLVQTSAKELDKAAKARDKVRAGEDKQHAKDAGALGKQLVTLEAKVAQLAA